MPRFLVISLGVLFLAACRRDDAIQTYRVSKETPMPSPRDGAPPSKEITWKTPAAWREQPPSAMRVGSFLITGPNAQTADVSIIPLSGAAGGDLANINRWRGQIQLQALTSAELKEKSQLIKPAGRSMLLIDFTSEKPLIKDRYKQRLIAAIYTQGSRTWFFKMMGEDHTVGEAKPAFLRFLETIRIAPKPANG